MRGLNSAERGQSVLEMALIVPLLILLLLGIIEVGRYAELAIVVANAARTGAVYGAQNLATAANTGGIQDAVQNDANLGTAQPYGTCSTGVLCVNSQDGLLPSVNPSLSPCQAIGDTLAPLPYVIVQTKFTTSALFSSTQFTFHGCAQMQVAE